MTKRNTGNGSERWKTAGLLSLVLALAVIPTRAEDPLLGEIKVIKCVGCEPGKVTLVIHDPIEVRDFEVTILDADYSKIVTRLPGKRVFDRGGCFYWNEAPKVTKPEPVKEAPKPIVKEPIKKGKKGKGKKGTAADSSLVKVETPEIAPEPTPEVIPSKCLPFERTSAPPPSLPD